MDNWHSQTMKNFKAKKPEELCYIIQDCKQAIEAMPDGFKVGVYMDEIHYAGMELKKRGHRYIPPAS